MVGFLPERFALVEGFGFEAQSVELPLVRAAVAAVYTRIGQ